MVAQAMVLLMVLMMMRCLWLCLSVKVPPNVLAVCWVIMVMVASHPAVMVDLVMVYVMRLRARVRRLSAAVAAVSVVNQAL